MNRACERALVKGPAIFLIFVASQLTAQARATVCGLPDGFRASGEYRRHGWDQGGGVGPLRTWVVELASSRVAYLTNTIDGEEYSVTLTLGSCEGSPSQGEVRIEVKDSSEQRQFLRDGTVVPITMTFSNCRLTRVQTGISGSYMQTTKDSDGGTTTVSKFAFTPLSECEAGKPSNVPPPPTSPRQNEPAGRTAPESSLANAEPDAPPPGQIIGPAVVAGPGPFGCETGWIPKSTKLAKQFISIGYRLFQHQVGDHCMIDRIRFIVDSSYRSMRAVSFSWKVTGVGPSPNESWLSTTSDDLTGVRVSCVVPPLMSDAVCGGEIVLNPMWADDLPIDIAITRESVSEVEPVRQSSTPPNTHATTNLPSPGVAKKILDFAAATAEDLAARDDAIEATRRTLIERCEQIGQRKLPLSRDTVQRACVKAGERNETHVAFILNESPMTLHSVATQSLPSGTYTFNFECQSFCQCDDLSCFIPEVKYRTQVPAVSPGNPPSEASIQRDQRFLKQKYEDFRLFGTAHQACYKKAPNSKSGNRAVSEACRASNGQSKVRIDGGYVFFVGETSGAPIRFHCLLDCHCNQADPACYAYVEKAFAFVEAP